MPLTERRKADRAQMAQAVVALATELGATARLKPEGESLSPHEVNVHIRAARGLCVTASFDGQSPQPDVHVVSWHMARDVDTCLADTFTRAGEPNRYHFRKATAVAYGFDNLLHVLRTGLELAASGEAFSAEREAAAIAKAGETAAERNARYAAWRSAPVEGRP